MNTFATFPEAALQMPHRSCDRAMNANHVAGVHSALVPYHLGFGTQILVENMKVVDLPQSTGVPRAKPILILWRHQEISASL